MTFGMVAENLVMPIKPPQSKTERTLIGAACFILGLATSEEYRRWGRTRLLEALGLRELI